MANAHSKNDVAGDYGEKLDVFLKEWLTAVDFTGEPDKREVEQAVNLIYRHGDVAAMQGFGGALEGQTTPKKYYAPDPERLVRQIATAYNKTVGCLLTPLLPANRGNASGLPFDYSGRGTILGMVRARLSPAYPTVHEIAMSMVEGHRLGDDTGYGKGFMAHYGCGWMHPAIANILTDEFIRLHAPELIMRKEFNKRYKDLLRAWVLLSKNAAGAWVFKNAAFILRSPRVFETTARGILHCETGPALSWGKGNMVFMLNGVKVPREVVELPSSAISVKNYVLNTANVDVRREVIKKVGIERVIQALGAIVTDKSKDETYELLEVDFQEGWGLTPRKYLKMINPSIGAYHVEAVHPDCETVKEALAWRNKTRKPPKQLT